MKKKKRMIISRSFVLLLSKISSKNPQKKSPKKKRPTKILNPTYTNPKRLGKFVCLFFWRLSGTLFLLLHLERTETKESSLLFSSPKARAQKKKKKKKKKKRDAGPVDPRAAE